ncbi:hypothetical protein EOD42_03450 [Rhodovarius crocodyli]|uniref:Phosphate starvation-inducible protein PsiF n=1 Tax=Rhodovarius crocodyli TaxID=1979269 RepID=A0A437MNE8_9PROT|nr:PsiF family protein [Rhodovarius crocodyli]RVT99168.1 hypothetical protein EOD42_03450 [Rhodovarius crocodyli]
MRVLLLVPAMLALAVPAMAESTRPARQPSEAQAAQQQRMRQCNTDARANNLSGDARKEFMRRCLAGQGAVAPSSTN